MGKTMIETLTNFEFKSGKTLPEVNIEYSIAGKANNNNVILLCHGAISNYSELNCYESLIGPGKVIDTNNNCVISTTVLGTPGSTSPSMLIEEAFPAYTIGDMVSAQYRLLSEKLDVPHLKGLIGASMGGYQVLTWATMYPACMDWIIPISTFYKTHGRLYALFELLTTEIKTNIAYQNKDYEYCNQHLLPKIYYLLYMWLYSPDFYYLRYNTNCRLTRALSLISKRNPKITDIRDLLAQFEALLDFDIEASLPQIKAKSLVIGVVEDQLFPVSVTLDALARSINAEKSVKISSQEGHIALSDLSKASNDIDMFLSQYY